jgi:peroxiredoxin
MLQAKHIRLTVVLLFGATLSGCSTSDAPAPAAGAAVPAKPQPPAESKAKPVDDVAKTDKLPEKDIAAALDSVAVKKAAVPANSGPTLYTAFYRADAGPPKMPKVQFSKREEKLCKVKVGDEMPAIELPELGGKPTKLASLLGKKATVIVFWKGDRRMAREQLADLGSDVIEPFEKEGVAVIGIAVKETDASATEALAKTDAKFKNLLDADGKAFAEVGSERLPRTYVLDPSGKIVWFDIEYSLTTRRELHDALRVLTAK